MRKYICVYWNSVFPVYFFWTSLLYVSNNELDFKVCTASLLMNWTWEDTERGPVVLFSHWYQSRRIKWPFLITLKRPIQVVLSTCKRSWVLSNFQLWEQKAVGSRGLGSKLTPEQTPWPGLQPAHWWGASHCRGVPAPSSASIIGLNK